MPVRRAARRSRTRTSKWPKTAPNGGVKRIGSSRLVRQPAALARSSTSPLRTFGSGVTYGSWRALRERGAAGDEAGDGEQGEDGAAHRWQRR